MRTQIDKLLRYIGVGLIALAVHLAVLFILVEAFEVMATIATALGFVIACGANFFLQARYVFVVNDRAFRRVGRYTIITLSTLFLNVACFHALVTLTPLHYGFAQFLTTAVVFLLNYLLNSLWTFSPIGFSSQDRAGDAGLDDRPDRGVEA